VSERPTSQLGPALQRVRMMSLVNLDDAYHLHSLQHPFFLSLAQLRVRPSSVNTRHQF
jgi:hypothetical protein